MRTVVTTSAAQQASAPAGPHRGLTEAEAARRLAEHGRNVVAAARTVPLYARVLAQLRDALILVLPGGGVWRSCFRRGGGGGAKWERTGCSVGVRRLGRVGRARKYRVPCRRRGYRFGGTARLRPESRSRWLVLDNPRLALPQRAPVNRPCPACSKRSLSRCWPRPPTFSSRQFLAAHPVASRALDLVLLTVSLLLPPSAPPITAGQVW
ncbi:cation-transporting P-type ATPase [Streptomyces sp. NPDC085540]|uniref:cation-transporting P-type ATPase n=1 Tax=Streptomyces sp. NPDC085540 TaxID=3365730 RepID=UPI0037CE0B38